MGAATTILLVDDHNTVRFAVAEFLRSKLNANIIEAPNGTEGLKQFLDNKVDIIITDINMPEMDGVEMVKKIRKKDKNVMIIAFTMLSDPLSIKTMIASGANSYVLKEAEAIDLIQAIEKACEKEGFFSSKVSEIVMFSLSNSLMEQDNQLTKRELEVLERVLLEKSNQEIADELFISLRTVEAHKHHIMEKVGAKNIAGLVKYALKHKMFGHILYE